MNFSTSRVLSLVVVAAAYVRAWSIPGGFWFVTLVLGPVLALIWFPERLDDLTYGAWYRGYRIDSHTPAGPLRRWDGSFCFSASLHCSLRVSPIGDHWAALCSSPLGDTKTRKE